MNMFTEEEENKINECVKSNFFSQSFFSDVGGCLKSKGFSQEQVNEAIRKLMDTKNAYEWAKLWERVSNGEDPNKVLNEYFSKKQKKTNQTKKSPQRKYPSSKRNKKK